MICAAVIFIVIAPAALAKVSSPEDNGSSPKPTCSISGSRNGSAPSPMRNRKPPIVADGIGRDLHQCEIDDRVRDPARVPDIDEHAQPRRRSRADHCDGGNAPRPTFSKPKIDVDSPMPVSAKPREVERAAAGLLEVADEQIDQNDPQDADRDVDKKDPAPRGVGDDKAAERRPHHRADQRRDADIGHRPHQVGFRHRPQQHEAADRHHHRPAHALHDARDDEAGSELAQPQPIEPSVNTTIAALNTRRAPNRSAVQPLIGMKTARLSR